MQNKIAEEQEEFLSREETQSEWVGEDNLEWGMHDLLDRRHQGRLALHTCCVMMIPSPIYGGDIVYGVQIFHLIAAGLPRCKEK